MKVGPKKFGTPPPKFSECAPLCIYIYICKSVAIDCRDISTFIASVTLICSRQLRLNGNQAVVVLGDSNEDVLILQYFYINFRCFRYVLNHVILLYTNGKCINNKIQNYIYQLSTYSEFRHEISKIFNILL